MCIKIECETGSNLFYFSIEAIMNKMVEKYFNEIM